MNLVTRISTLHMQPAATFVACRPASGSWSGLKQGFNIEQLYDPGASLNKESAL